MTGWPQNAYVGQKVTPATSNPWFTFPTLKHCTDGPRFGHVYTVAAIGLYAGKTVTLALEGFCGDWQATAFRPVKDTTAAVEEIKRQALKPSLPVEELVVA